MKDSDYQDVRNRLNLALERIEQEQAVALDTNELSQDDNSRHQ